MFLGYADDSRDLSAWTGPLSVSPIAPDSWIVGKATGCYSSERRVSGVRRDWRNAELAKRHMGTTKDRADFSAHARPAFFWALAHVAGQS